MPTPGFWTSGLQDWENKCLSPYATQLSHLSQQSQETSRPKLGQTQYCLAF